MMLYPVLIEDGTEETAFGVVVPDLPGCFPAGDTLDEALEAAKEAAAIWVDAALDGNITVPPPSNLDAVRLDHQPQKGKEGRDRCVRTRIPGQTLI